MSEKGKLILPPSCPFSQFYTPLLLQLKSAVSDILCFCYNPSCLKSGDTEKMLFVGLDAVYQLSFWPMRKISVEVELLWHVLLLISALGSSEIHYN